MEFEELCDYLFNFLPFPFSYDNFREFLLMKKDFPPPYSLTDPKLVKRGEIIKVIETTPYEWLLTFWRMQKETRNNGELCLEDRHSLGWFLYLLHQHKKKS